MSNPYGEIYRIVKMENRYLWKKYGWFFLTILGIVSFHSACSQVPSAATTSQNLVWPPPPDIPRVKHIATIYSEESIGAVKKPSIFDRLIGRDPRSSMRSLRRPYGICTDSTGRIYVADSGQGMVFIFDRANKLVTFLGDKGQGKLDWPIDVVADSADNIYVSDVRIQNVYIFNPDGSFKSALAKQGEIVVPAGLGYDRERNRILVVDSKAHNVKVYTTGSEFITKFGERGIGEGQFNFPTNIIVGNDGYVYVVETGNHRVQVFDQDYEYFDDFGTLGIRPGEFRRPKGIALDSENNIYVVDSDFCNFQIFNQDYRILTPVGTRGTANGRFYLPAGIHIDGNDMIYVSDQFNQRIQIFQYLKYDSDSK